jgi:hypothetical protein
VGDGTPDVVLTVPVEEAELVIVVGLSVIDE